MTSDARHLYLCRHGETALNAQDRIRGRANPPLDDVGEKEAARLAKALLQFAPFTVYSSPLQRAVSTAEAIAKTAGTINHIDELFNDRDYGTLNGLLKKDVLKKYGSIDAVPGVEPEANVIARSFPALRAVLEESPGDVVVVTHDAIIRPVLHLIAPALSGKKIPTGSWSDLMWVDDGWVVDIALQKPK